MISARENHTNISIPSLANKTSNYKNNSRNGNKNIKFAGQKQTNTRTKFLEDTNKNHQRAKSYFTERKVLSNMLPQKLEVKSRISHSVEIKKKTIIRGDKYKIFK